MKINEIAINEGIEKLGKYVFNTAKNAWELANDTKALSKGGVKSADNLVSPAELSALRRDPVPPSSGPAVWRKRGDPNFDTTPSTLQGPSTSGTIPKPIVLAPKPRANTSAYDQEVLNRHDMNPRMPNKGKPSAEADAYAAEKAAQAKRTAAEKQAAADDLTRQVSPADDLSKEIKPGADAAGGRREPSIDTPLDDLTKQIKPGADTPKTTGGRQEPSINRPAEPANGVTFSKDEIFDLIKRGGGGAAQAAEKEAAKKSGIPWGKAAAATGALGLPTAYNKLSPPDWPKAEYTPYSVLGDLGVKAGKNLWKQTDMPKVDFVDPTSNITPSADAPLPSKPQVDTAIKNDPANQEVTQQIEKWNQDHPDNPIKESYTNELNRIVFLSRP